jgi:hypothetical protein
MKKIFLALLLSVVLSPSVSFAQYTFPLTELQKLTNKNASDFETVMIEKDYSIQSKLSNATTKIYWSDKPGVSDKKYIMSRFQVPGGATKLTFSFTDKKHYLELKKALAAGGFKFVKEENKTVDGVETVWYHYSGNGFTVSLCSYTKDVTWFVAEAHI